MEQDERAMEQDERAMETDSPQPDPVRQHRLIPSESQALTYHVQLPNGFVVTGPAGFPDSQEVGWNQYATTTTNAGCYVVSP